MKKLIFSVLIFLFVMMGLSAQKFGYMNYQNVLEEMPTMNQAMSELEGLKDQLQKQVEDMVAELQKEYSRIQKIISGGCLTKKVQSALVEELKEKEQQILLFEQNMVLQLQNKEAELMQPLLKKMTGAITEVAKENSLQMIFDQETQVILFAEQSANVTSMVRAKLGMQ